MVDRVTPAVRMILVAKAAACVESKHRPLRARSLPVHKYLDQFIRFLKLRAGAAISREVNAIVRRLPVFGQRFEVRTLRYRLARRPVLSYWRSEKSEGIYPIITAKSASPLQVVEKDS